MSRRSGRNKKRGKQKAGRFGLLIQSFLFGDPLDEPTTARVRELTGLLMIGVSTWLFISLLTYYMPIEGSGAAGKNLGGLVGHYLAKWAFMLFGMSGYLVCALGICWGFIILARKRVHLAALRVFGALCFIVSASFILDLALTPQGAEFTSTSDNELPYGYGGVLPALSRAVLIERFGSLGLWVLLLTVTSISFMLATEMAFYPAIRAFGAWLDDRPGERALPAVWGWIRQLAGGLWDFLRGADLGEATGGSRTARALKKAGPRDAGEDAEEDEEEYEDEDEDEEDAEEDEEDWEYEEEDEEEGEEEDDEEEDDDSSIIAPAASTSNSRSKGAGKLRKLMAAPNKTAISQPVYEPPTPPPGPWTLPPPDLLEPPEGSAGQDTDFLERCARALETSLKSFRVEAEVVAAQVGPAVTLFELTVAQGTRMNSVSNLSSEIAATLRAKSVRIIAPIPGKSTIGIEVPNANRRTVRISELVSQKAYDKKFIALPLFLGMDAEGRAIVADLAHMPHLLLAGTTGSGKSVCINTIIASLLLTRSPHDVKMILIDPKMVELQVFKDIPHLELPVVTDMKQATNVLLWAVEKMDSRYKLFKQAGVRNIKGYNELGEELLRKRMEDEFNEERTPRHVPYMVVVIDEMADLMMQSKKEAELAITRLAQKARAVGIHVIVATQRPSTDVITGVIKGNLPTRIAFKVSSGTDSRVILDSQGADKLLGKGDMLYAAPNASQLARVQGALLEDHELEALVEFVCKESAPNFNQEIVQAATGTAPPGQVGQGGERVDEMFNEAVNVVLKYKRGSASLLQRALGIGYTRASRLIDQMTDGGILGEHRGSKSREILMTLEDWEENLANIEHSSGG